MSRLMATTMALPVCALLRSSKCATRSAATLGDARLGADHLLQRGPAALEPGLLALFLVFGQLVDLVVDGAAALPAFSPSLASRLS
jgi:hypothetical protein